MLKIGSLGTVSVTMHRSHFVMANVWPCAVSNTILSGCRSKNSLDKQIGSQKDRQILGTNVIA